MNGAIDAASSSEPIGLLPGMPIKSEPGHADAAELEVDVGTRRHGGDAASPGGEHLVVAAAVRADPRQTAEMVQDDRQVGHGLGKSRRARAVAERPRRCRVTAPSAPTPGRPPDSRPWPAPPPFPGWRFQDAGPRSPCAGSHETGWGWRLAALPAPTRPGLPASGQHGQPLD